MKGKDFQDSNLVCRQLFFSPSLPQVVFLSGLGENIQTQGENDFYNFALKNHVSYLAFDYTSYALNNKQISNFGLNEVTEKTLEILSNSSQKMILVGNCFGGNIAWKMAKKMPNHIVGLLLFAPLCEFSDFSWKSQSLNYISKLIRYAEVINTDTKKMGKLMLFQQLFTAALNTQVYPEDETSYKGKITVIHGEKDQLIPCANSLLFKKECPQAQVHLINDSHTLLSPLSSRIKLKELQRFYE